jgi:hypothetical protein
MFYFSFIKYFEFLVVYVILMWFLTELLMKIRKKKYTRKKKILQYLSNFKIVASFLCEKFYGTKIVTSGIL